MGRLNRQFQIEVGNLQLLPFQAALRMLEIGCVLPLQGADLRIPLRNLASAKKRAIDMFSVNKT